MDEMIFTSLPVGTYIRTNTDKVYCNPTAYYQYRAPHSEYYPKDTIFKVVRPSYSGSVCVHIVIDGKEIPNTGGAHHCCHFSASAAPYFDIVPYVPDCTDIVY